MTDSQKFLSQLAQTARALHTTFDAHLKSMGLTAARGRVLLYLTMHPEGVSQSDVTTFLRVENPTAVRILDGLETLGHIKRLPDPHDRRAKLIALTDEGAPVAQEVVAATHVLNQILMAGITPEEIRLAGSVVQRILANLNAARLPQLEHDETEA